MSAQIEKKTEIELLQEMLTKHMQLSKKLTDDVVLKQAILHKYAIEKQLIVEQLFYSTDEEFERYAPKITEMLSDTIRMPATKAMGNSEERIKYLTALESGVDEKIEHYRHKINSRINKP